MFVAALFEEQPVLVDITSEIPIKHILPSVPKRSRMEQERSSEKQDALHAKQTSTVIAWTSNGGHILAGTSKGWINIIETESREILYSERLSSNLIIHLRPTASGRNLLVNSSDRIIRTLHVPDLSHPKTDYDNLRLPVEHRFQDLVNRLSWNHVTFSSTGDYVAASTWNNHDIYVWERSHGSLVKILEGKEELTVVEVRCRNSNILHTWKD